MCTYIFLKKKCMHTCVVHIYIYAESCWSKSHPSKDWKWSTPGEKTAAGPGCPERRLRAGIQRISRPNGTQVFYTNVLWYIMFICLVICQVFTFISSLFERLSPHFLPASPRMWCHQVGENVAKVLPETQEETLPDAPRNIGMSS